MKNAVILLLFDRDNSKVLAVSRRHNPDLWGMPGGKVDPGESNVEALLRETREETGLNLRANEVTPIFSDACPGNVTYWCTTYVCEVKINPGSLKVEEGLNLEWMWPEDLCKPQHSPFANYNSRVFQALSRYKEL